MGYGSTAVNYLIDYFQGKVASLSEFQPTDSVTSGTAGRVEGGLLKETIAPRAHLPPLLTKLSDRPSEKLNYIGVSYGLTAQLQR